MEKKKKLNIKQMEILGKLPKNFTKKDLNDENIFYLMKKFKFLKDLKKQYKKQLKFKYCFENEKHFKKFKKFYNLKIISKNYKMKENTEYLSISSKWGKYNPEHYIQFYKIVKCENYNFKIIIENEFITDDKREIGKTPIFKFSKYYDKNKNHIKFKNRILYKFKN